MNGLELYLLARKLDAIAADALPPDSALRRVPPGARLVLGEVAGHPGTTAGEIAGRTGLQPGQVSALVSELAGQGLLEADGERITVRGGAASLPEAASLPPVDEALTAALRPADAAAAGELAGMLESLARRLGTGTLPRSASDFDAAYSGSPPWDTGRPQPAFAELAAAGALRGRVLDVGCGTGEHALMAAGLGLTAAGIDSSPAAIEIARRKAAQRNLPARFTVHDALDLGALGQQFDTVIDSALFHVFTDEQRTRYARSLGQALPAGGRYFMLCFSDRQPPGFGPRRVSREEIEATFADGWRIDEITPVTLETTTYPAGIQAWRAALTRA